MVLRELDVFTGEGSLPDSDGVRELVTRGFLVPLGGDAYRLAIPNPDARAVGLGDDVPTPILRRRGTSRGIVGERLPIEAVEARRPLHVKGRAA